MGKKLSTTLGKVVLACSIGLTGVISNLSIPAVPVQAEEMKKEVDYKLQGETFLKLVKEGKWDELYKDASPVLQSYATKEYLGQLWVGLTSSYGAIKDAGYKDSLFDGVHTKVTFTVMAEAGSYDLQLKYLEGKLSEFLINPAYPPNSFQFPSYHNPENYLEKQVVIGEGDFALPGVLTMPKGEGPFPVVVLVHGSGANDMDETGYVFKPFRDIAVGLANEGIAVLRYDKRTNTHAIKSSVNPKLSIQEETVIDANLAVEKLKSLPEIDSEHIFVLGHSQGGYALPKIIEADKNKDIKGGIAVAAPSGKFQDLLLWQVEQSLARAKSMGVPEEQIKALEANVAVIKEHVNLINDPQYSTENLPANFLIGNTYWWYDLRSYIPTELAKTQDVPMLILQGDKDIQVPTSHFNDWKSKLKERKNIEYKLYPDMFHMIVNYPGAPNGMSEYMTPGNVPQEFVFDIANWVKTGTVVEAVNPTDFEDYKPNQYWSEAFAWAIEEGYIQGYANENRLKPLQPMTESQYLKVFLRYTLGATFTDESLESIYQLAEEFGLPVKNKPNTSLSRGEAAVLIANSFSEKLLSEKESVQWLYDHGITNGYLDENGNSPRTYKSFMPNEKMTRGHLVTMLYRMHNEGLTN